MTESQLEKYRDVIEPLIKAIALKYEQLSLDGSAPDLEQEAWFGLLVGQFPDDIRNPKAFFGVVIRNHVLTDVRKNYRRRHMLRLSAAEWGGAQLEDGEESVVFLSLDPQHRDYYNARRAVLEDYFYI
jgi:DNA-directed RNA polymerase specialized sigma24 family protein